MYAHLSRNIPSTIFCGSIFSEFLIIAQCTLTLEDFVPKASQLYTTIPDKICAETLVLVENSALRKVQFPFSMRFVLLFAKFSFWKENWELSRNLSFKLLGNS